MLKYLGKLCPNEWIFHSNSCYKLIFHTDNTYESAKKLCADSYNSNLISIGSLKEAEFIAELLLDQDYGENVS